MGIVGPVRCCRRWRTINNEPLGAVWALAESAIEKSNGAAWRDLMQAGSIEFETMIRNKRHPRPIGPRA